MDKPDNRICARLTPELLAKMQTWKSYGFHLSDIVRQALALLPSSPDQRVAAPARIKSLPKQGLQVELKDERVALKALQEW
jgi:hypothetical protein